VNRVPIAARCVAIAPTVANAVTVRNARNAVIVVSVVSGRIGRIGRIGPIGPIGRIGRIAVNGALITGPNPRASR
jgi:hypothetical protein